MKPTIRSCLVCRQRVLKSDLVRLCWDRPLGRLVVDVLKTGGKRGAYLHATAGCIAGLLKARNLKAALRLGQNESLTNENLIQVQSELLELYKF